MSLLSGIVALKAVLGLVFSFLVSGNPDPVPTLYFLNKPESIRTLGVVADQVIPANQKARFFLHHVNRTKNPQMFVFELNQPMKNVRIGIRADRYPGIAGAAAAEQFLKSTPKSRGTIKLKIMLKPSHTVSAIYEGVTEVNTRMLCKLGDGPLIPGAVVATTTNLLEEKWGVLKNEPVTISMAGDNSPGPIKGDYGTTHYAGITATKDGTVDVSMMPKGGHLIFVWKNNGQVRRTPLTWQYKTVHLFRMKVKAGQKVFLEMIPTGGFPYPVEIRFAYRS